MRLLLAVSATAMLAAYSTPLFAQAASDQVKRQCRSYAEGQARSLMSQKRAKVKDLEAGISRTSSTWQEQVAHYMAQSANRSDSMTESELAALGESYCVSRRPTDSR